MSFGGDENGHSRNLSVSGTERLVTDALSYGVELEAAETDRYFLSAHGRPIEERR